MSKEKKQGNRLGLVMKLAIGFSALFFLVIGSVYIYGMTTPESHTASGSRMVDAPLEEVFALEHNPKAAPEWREEVAEIKHFEDHGEGLIGWTEVWTDGNRFTFTVTEYIENERLVVKIDDVNDYFNGTWTYEFEAKDDKTVVTITENGHIPNPLIRGLYRLSADPAGPLTTHLDQLEAHFGEDSD